MKSKKAITLLTRIETLLSDATEVRQKAAKSRKGGRGPLEAKSKAKPSVRAKKRYAAPAAKKRR